MTPLDALLAEAAATPTDGWELGRLGPRIRTEVPWDYDELVRAHVAAAASLLDIGTGGGEWLAGYFRRPDLTVATESWPPNIAVAAARLRPLGAFVVGTEAAPDNADQRPGDRRGRLPFAGASFEAVIARHEAFVAAEVARVLAPGGSFVTQQSGSGTADLCALLGLGPAPPERFTLDDAVAQVEAAGLDVVATDAGVATTTYTDVGALVWWLRQVPWAVPSFDVAAARPALERLHGTGGPYVTRSEMFALAALRR